MMGDLPRWIEYEKNGLIMMGDLSRWKEYIYKKTDGNNMKNGLIMMDDLPRWKECDMTSVKNRTYLAKS